MKGEFDRQFELRTGLQKRDKSKYINTSESHTGEWGAGKGAIRGSRSLPKIFPIAIVAVLGTMLLIIKSPSENPGADQTAVPTEGDHEAVLKAARTAVDKQQLAIATVKKFLDAESVDEMANYVLERDRVAPLMKKYYETHPIPTSVHERNIAILSSALKFETSRPYVCAVTFKVENVPDGSPIALRDCGDHFEIDWECYVGFNEVSIADYLKYRPDEPVQFRCIVKPSDYYNFEFEDESIFQAFELSVTGESDYLIGYAERSGFELGIANRLTELIGSAPAGVPVILEVKPGSRDHLVHIVEMVKEHWITD